MICTKCGTPLKESAKFCTKCGTAISVTDDTLQNEGTRVESVATNSTKSIAVIALIIMLFVSVGLIISNLYAKSLRLENEKKYYQDRVEEYENENENAIDKTSDAISSWLEYFGY